MIRIAMWSGPRNISTAMMRSWENRADTMVSDEPLYGPYLFRSQKQHPMSDEIIADQGKNQQPIIRQLTSQALPQGINIHYQKHMCHHLFSDDDIQWVFGLFNVFLIRAPEQVVASYDKKHQALSPEDLGYPQQLRLFEAIKRQHNQTPLVIDGELFLHNPRYFLNHVCEHIGVPFDHNMLKWPKGYRESDGIWAPHWYNRVIESTEFNPPQAKTTLLSTQQQRIVDQCQPYYQKLRTHRITLTN